MKYAEQWKLTNEVDEWMVVKEKILVDKNKFFIYYGRHFYNKFKEVNIFMH